MKFKENIGFLHPNKRQKLYDAINSYVNLEWNLPKTQKDLFEFVEVRGRFSSKRKEIRFNSVIKQNLEKLKQLLKVNRINSKILGPWTNPYSPIWYCLILKGEEFNKIKGGAK